MTLGCFDSRMDLQLPRARSGWGTSKRCPYGFTDLLAAAQKLSEGRVSLPRSVEDNPFPAWHKAFSPGKESLLSPFLH